MPNNGFAFADPRPSPDDFNTLNPQDVFADSKIYAAPVPEAIPAPWRTPPVMALDEVLGNRAVQQIRDSGRIVFHSVGDTGGIKEPSHQFAVADAMTGDLSGKDYKGGRAAFFYHLGDVVYYFGQEQYYYDQFYDPYRDYDAPIFAIPGNHDGVVFPGEKAKSLEPFSNNFCTRQPGHNPTAQGFARTTMTQPGVYFTLDAPFVKIIGLYSNTSETTGIISGQAAGTHQRDFLVGQLQAAASQRMQKQNAFGLIIAVHHPPFTGSSRHFPSPGMLAEIDAACKQAGIWPDLVLSGHAHLYERYTRSVSGHKIPYVVAGDGGYFHLPGFKKGKKGAAPKAPVTGTDGKGNPLTLEAYDDSAFGFLRLTVDAASVLCEFLAVDEKTGKTSTQDSFTLDLNKHDFRRKGRAAASGGRGR